MLLGGLVHPQRCFLSCRGASLTPVIILRCQQNVAEQRIHQEGVCGAGEAGVMKELHQSTNALMKASKGPEAARACQTGPALQTDVAPRLPGEVMDES